MSKFDTIADLIEAAAQQSHVANLHVGGIFSEDGSRHSDIEAERRVAAQRGTQFVHANYAHLEGFTAGQSVRYIPHVGYVNA